MKAQWYTKKWVAVTLHVLFWSLFFLLPYLLRPQFENNAAKEPARNISGFYYVYFLNNAARVLFFYANAYLFIPRLIYRKKYWTYVAVQAAVLTTLLFWDRALFGLFLPQHTHRVLNFFAFNLYPYFFIIISSTAFRIIRDRIESEKRIKEKETETLKTELLFLRSQVSPHFMFNVLNNMVALARKKSDLLEPSLIKLSSLLRYMLYETNEDKVALEKEVEYLQSYIDLQQQRFGKNVKINTALTDTDNGYTLEPMLLIPFVENAFKHGTGLVGDAQIDVQLSVRNGLLLFSVRNRYNVEADGPKDKTSGIGLANVQRRLNLLYKDRHSLRIEKQEGWFTASLQLNLH